MAIVALLQLAIAAAAIEPDPSSPTGTWQPNVTLKPKWSSTNTPPSSWMQGPILNALDDSNATRASKAPTLTFNSSGEGTIRYYADGDGNCGKALACADKTVNATVPESTWKIHFVGHGVVHPNPNGYTVRWCDNPNYSGSNCWDVERVALHELGHVLGLGHNSVNDQSMTIMYGTIPSKNNAGWQTHVLRSCDQARLQVQYDVPTTSSAYATCLAGLANAGANGLKTTATFSTSATVLCGGQSATYSGSLNVQNLSGYGKLGGNDLGSRTVLIQRSSPGQGSFSTYTTATTNSAGNWSRTFSFAAGTDYDWRARFDGDSGLNGNSSASIRVRWLNAC